MVCFGIMNSEFDVRSLGECRFDSPLLAMPGSVGEERRVLYDATMLPSQGFPRDPATLEVAGPKRKIFFDPAVTRAAIVTCGGLCPGLNDVIRAVTMVLWYRYGVTDILGLHYGYEGMTLSGQKPTVLTPDVVEDIHQHGGTILGTSRGPQDVGEMVDFLIAHNIDILFAVGGDGSQRGALAIAGEIEKRGEMIAVVGIPKTIDNDISVTDRTFGFETAVALSQAPINSAHMEAKAVRNGIGLVKLMGRESGFVAAHATLASSDVNLLLIPEVPFELPKVLDFLEKRLARKAHAVLVVAEGAGQELLHAAGTDHSGNKRLGDIGLFLKKAITEHFEGVGLHVSVKYIDPSYMIRSASANADDSVFCFQLAENAVHAGLAGKTAMVVGLLNGHFVNVPTAKAVAVRKRVDPNGSLWSSILDNTGQPDVGG